MSLASAPSTGFSLHGFANDDADPKQALNPGILFKLSDDLLEDVKKAHKAQGGLQLLTGSTPKIKLGNRTIDLTISAEAFRHELYSASIESLSDFNFTGILGHRAELKVPERKQSVGGDAALAALQNSLASYQHEKEAKAVNISDQLVKEPKNRWEAAKDSKNARRRGITSAHTQGSPSGASAGQHNGASTTSVPASASAERTRAMRTPMIHLLAMWPLSLQDIAQKTRIPKEEVEEMLQKIAKQEGGRWGLTDRAYKELDVWKFGYSTQEERQAAVDNAIRAYDRQRLAPDDKYWQMLLPKKDRDQGIVLSKLHLAPPPASSLLTPNAAGSGDEGDMRSAANTPRLGPAPGSTPKIGSAALSKRLFSKDPKKARAAEDAKEKKRKEREAAAAANSDREGGKVARKKPTTKANTTNPKVKSAEIVHDSSEESSGEIYVRAHAHATANRSAASSSQPKSAAAAANVVKSAPNAPAKAATATSTSTSTSKQKQKEAPLPAGRDEKTAPARAKAAAGATPKVAGTPKTASTPAARPAATAASKSSKSAALGGKSTPNGTGGLSAPASQSRPQLSPQKGGSRPTVPSPLGAARPRVASDVTERGIKRPGAETPKGVGITNGVRKRQDTVTSTDSNTPRINGDHPKPRKAPVNGTKPPSTNGAAARDEHALKRKHVDSPIHSQEDGRSSTKHRKTESTSSQSQKSQASSVGAASSTDLRLHRSNSSDSTSSVMRDITYNQGVEEARRFRDIYYPQYATEYDKQMAMEERGEKVPQRDRERLWDMHRRIQTMKLEMRIASAKEHDDES